MTEEKQTLEARISKLEQEKQTLESTMAIFEKEKKDLEQRVAEVEKQKQEFEQKANESIAQHNSLKVKLFADDEYTTSIYVLTIGLSSRLSIINCSFMLAAQ